MFQNKCLRPNFLLLAVAAAPVVGAVDAVADTVVAVGFVVGAAATVVDSAVSCTLLHDFAGLSSASCGISQSDS